MTSLPKIEFLHQRRLLFSEIAEYIGQLIIDGTLPPGSKIPERELCDSFQVSRTPIREALKVLANDGLVTLEPNRGAWVSPITVADLEEAFPVMGALEALAGELAAQRITDAELANIERMHAELVESYAERDLSRYFILNQQVHSAILETARNPTLSAHYLPLATRLRRARYLANTSSKRWAEAIAEHEQMIKALRERDGAKLGRIMRAHLRGKYLSVIAQLQQENPS